MTKGDKKDIKKEKIKNISNNEFLYGSNPDGTEVIDSFSEGTKPVKNYSALKQLEEEIKKAIDFAKNVEIYKEKAKNEVNKFREEVREELEIFKKKIEGDYEKKINEMQDKIGSKQDNNPESIWGKIEIFTKEMQDMEDGFNNTITEKTNDLEDKIENSKLSVIETIGLFMALFTFIAVDFQIFRVYTDPLIIGALILILLSAIFLFIVIFDYFILQARRIRKTEIKKDSKRYKEDDLASRARKVLIPVSIVILAIGFFIFFITNKSTDNDYKKNNEDLNLLNNKINNFEEEIQGIKSNEKDIKNLNTNFFNMKDCIETFGFTTRCFRNKNIR